MIERLLTIAEVAERLSLSNRTVRNLLQGGHLCKYVRIGRAMRVREAALDAWIDMKELQQPQVGEDA